MDKEESDLTGEKRYSVNKIRYVKLCMLLNSLKDSIHDPYFSLVYDGQKGGGCSGETIENQENQDLIGSCGGKSYE